MDLDQSTVEVVAGFEAEVAVDYYHAPMDSQCRIRGSVFSFGRRTSYVHHHSVAAGS